ncbi:MULTISPECIES: glycosyltransferase family 2 protein [unclassified Nostoc]|uniref:glycosyltransferase family 2 protein n=1 Tax=unclassified Nostoc TaxID=2593658 RepID=UPI000CF34630|nr:glycosyltransferase [Nostoc sp. 'Peltigera membranacea cyanobiont' N6]AVH62370.1 family 2 glycosyltransferase [Nostoc sp. 'Peltigera membranacea cyanobiont' N6]
MVRVSVVIPCYNAYSFVEKTIISALDQITQQDEVIVIDDGSTDDSADIILSFGNKIRAYFGANQGASAARNRGTDIAQGKFIQYLDADDLLRADALEKRVNALEASGADVAYSDWQKLHENETGEFLPGNVIARKIEDVHPDPQIALFTNFWAPPAALLYRREIVDAIGGWNESLPIIQDARFLLDAALVGGKFVYVPGVGADYRVHKNKSLSSRDPVGFVKDCFHNNCQIEEFWRHHGGLTPERSSALVNGYDYTSRTLFMTEEKLFQENLHRLYQLQPGFSLSFPKLVGMMSTILGQQMTRSVMKLLGKARVS